MKYIYFLIVTVLSLTAINSFAESEMDSEINDLQVRIVKIAPKPKTEKAKPVKAVTPKTYTYSAKQAPTQKHVQANFYQAARVSHPVVVASAATPVLPVQQASKPSETRTPVDYYGNTNTPQVVDQDEAEQSQGNIHAKTKPQTTSTQLIRRTEFLWGFTSGSFDGPDSSTLIPSGVSSPYNSSFTNGMLLTDIDFGSSQFFIETGATLMQMGSGTGLATNNLFSQSLVNSEKVTLTYFGVPLNLKWRMSEQRDSSFFVKAGAIPTYMISHAYLSSTNFNDENRFGAYNTFDILLDAGVGYDQKVWRDLHAVLDVSAFQGVLPVLTNFSVFNYGLMVSLGAAYIF